MESSNQTTDSQLDIKKLLRLLIPKLINLVNVVAILTVLGFFVVQSYITSFSQIFTYNISAIQYIAAGTNLMLALAWNFFLPIILVVFVLLIIYSVLVTLFKIKAIEQLWRRMERIFGLIHKKLSPHLHRVWISYQVFTSVSFIVFLSLFGLFYGYAYYSQSPRMFGGGMPSDVVLVFKEEQSQNSVWAFPINSKNLRQSEPIQLLIELTDGLIVRDPSTKIVMIVKNDVLQGIIDVYQQLPSGTTGLGTSTQTPPITATP